MQVIIRAYMQQPMQSKIKPLSGLIGFYRVNENTRWEPVCGSSHSELANGTSQSDLANGIGHSKQANGTSSSKVDHVIKSYQVMYNELTDADQAILLPRM